MSALPALAAWLAIALLLPSHITGQDRWRTDFTRHSIPIEEIVSGGEHGNPPAWIPVGRTQRA